jgi:hypothetical protein
MSSWPRELESLLDYEVRSSTRNRRFASLVVVASRNGSVTLANLPRSTIRESDEVFKWEADKVILMGETDKVGALEAVKRYQLNCTDSIDLRFAVSSYPEDGQTASALLRAVQGRIRKAKASRPGAVVSSG